MGFDKRITPELFSRIREEFLGLPAEWTKDRKGEALLRKYTEFSLRTLQGYAAILDDAAPSVLDAYCDGKISFTSVSVIYSINRGVQEILLPDVLSGKLTPSSIIIVRSLVKEGLPVSAAIARATGEVPRDEPVRSEKPKNLNSLMDEITKMGSRWRSMVSMAMDLVDGLERTEGINLELFERAYLLRHLVGEQYEFIDQKVKRYITTIKKRLEARAGLSPITDHEPIEEGVSNDDSAGSGETGDASEKRDGCQDGQTVPDQPGAGTNQGR